MFFSVVIVCVTYFGSIHSTASPTVAEGIGWTGRTFSSGELIFEDNFNSLNGSLWRHESLGPGHEYEFQWYTNSTENSYVENGVLHIVPTLHNESDIYVPGNFHPIASAQLDTLGLFSFKYGTMEINARVPLGSWLWPALWMMPVESTYGPWPISGELDLMEARSNQQMLDNTGTIAGIQQVASTLNWGPSTDIVMWQMTHWTRNNNTALGYSDGFHKYKLVWTPESIHFYLDDELLGGITPPNGGFWSLAPFSGNNPWINGTSLAPFDQQFYPIMNVAVGGLNFFPDNWIYQGGKPWNNNLPDAVLSFFEARDQWLPTWNITTDQSHLMVDYVRVWAI